MQFPRAAQATPFFVLLLGGFAGSTASIFLYDNIHLYLNSHTHAFNVTEI